jgi:hypothetical protein
MYALRESCPHRLASSLERVGCSTSGAVLFFRGDAPQRGAPRFFRVAAPSGAMGRLLRRLAAGGAQAGATSESAQTEGGIGA